MGASEKGMSSQQGTHLEEFRDPAKLEHERAVPFGHVLQYHLGLIRRHVLVRIDIIREAKALLDCTDALVAKVVNDEQVRWECEGKDGDPESPIHHARQEHETDNLGGEEDGNGSHQGQLLDRSDSEFHENTRFGGTKGVS